MEYDDNNSNKYMHQKWYFYYKKSTFLIIIVNFNDWFSFIVNFSHGLSLAICETIFANDIDKNIKDTCRFNFSGVPFIKGNIADLN